MAHVIKIGQTIAEIWRFNAFSKGRHPPSWSFEIQVFKWSLRLGSPICIAIPNMKRSRDFCDFRDGSRPDLGFSKIPYFNGNCAVIRHLAEFHINGFFEMAAVRHLLFVGGILDHPRY